MGGSILTKEHITSYINKCIDSLSSGDSSRLTEFATLMQTLAMVTDDSIYQALPQSIGSYANELSRFRILVAVPILGEEDRKKCQQCMQKATSEGVKGLKILKRELCESPRRSSGNILKAIAKFSKQGYLMYTLRTQFTVLPGGKGFQEE